MAYSSVKTIESKAAAGARFTIKKMTVRRRQAVEDLGQPFEERLRPLREELEPLDKAYAAAREAAMAVGKAERDQLVAGGMSREEAWKQAPYGEIDFPDEQFQRWLDLRRRQRRIDRDEGTPAAVRYCLVSVETRIDGEWTPGFEIDGILRADKDELLDVLLEAGPDELYDEIALAVAREMGLLPEEKQNLSLPSTSAAAVDGKTIPGTAAPAETPDTIISADAASITDPGSASVRNTP